MVMLTVYGHSPFFLTEGLDVARETRKVPS